MDLSGKTFPVPFHKTWEIVDGSKLKTFATCPRQFFYEYCLGWRRESPNNHLIFGTSWHESMEQLLVGGFNQDSVLAAYERFENDYRKTFAADTDALYSPKNPSRAFDAIVEYTKKYRSEADKYETIETEIAGTVVFDEEFTLHYRMDSILKNTELNLYYSQEHKTGSVANWQWQSQWALAFQIWIYTHVLYCLYPPEQVRGVEINGVFFRKVKDNSSAERTAFLRVPCWKTVDQMQAGYEDVLYFLQQLRNEYLMLEDSNDTDIVLRAFPRNPESCTKYFGCTWHDFCTTWANPLQSCAEPPIGFTQEWWNPADKEAKVTHHVGGK